jgi:hypothetical protein
VSLPTNQLSPCCRGPLGHRPCTCALLRVFVSPSFICPFWCTPHLLIPRGRVDVSRQAAYSSLFRRPLSLITQFPPPISIVSCAPPANDRLFHHSDSNTQIFHLAFKALHDSFYAATLSMAGQRISLVGMSPRRHSGRMLLRVARRCCQVSRRSLLRYNIQMGRLRVGGVRL